MDKSVTNGQLAYLDVVAMGTDERTYLVDEILFNDVPVDTPTIDDALVQRDGVLRFVMKGEKAAGTEMRGFVRPPSISYLETPGPQATVKLPESQGNEV
jgi:putative alpha-1,2-mannosidase